MKFILPERYTQRCIRENAIECLYFIFHHSNDGGKNYLSDSKSWGNLKGKEKEIVIESWHYV